MIVKKDNKWLVMDSSGKKVLGTHYSKEDAKDQLAAIEISKKKKVVQESPNFLNNSMNTLTEYYKKMCEDLQNQIVILEKKIKDKKAKKDYDGDGKVESGTEEYLGSRDKAIKKAKDKKLNEAATVTSPTSSQKKAKPSTVKTLSTPVKGKGIDSSLNLLQKTPQQGSGVDSSIDIRSQSQVNSLMSGVLGDRVSQSSIRRTMDRAYESSPMRMVTSGGADTFSTTTGGSPSKFGATSVSPTLNVRPGGGYSTTSGIGGPDVDLNNQVKDFSSKMGLGSTGMFWDPKAKMYVEREKTDREVAQEIVDILSGGGGGGMFGKKGADPRGKNKSRRRMP